MNIEVFYHLYIPPSETYRMWTWWVDEQLALIVSAGLAARGKVNMTITLPMYWLADVNHPVHLYLEVQKYIQTRYPFVNIIDIRDTGLENIYEGQTLQYLHKHCLSTDSYVLYIHSKGFVSNTPYVSNWRQVLNYFTIVRWQDCISKLDIHDVVGVKDLTTSNNRASGNFWWSKSSYVKQLANPIDSTKYALTSEGFPNQPGYRYAFEEWIASNNPKTFYIVDTKVNHYKDYCFI